MKTLERWVYSRDWLKRNHCGRGEHWYRRWVWRDSVSYTVPGGGISPQLSGWETRCEACNAASILDVATPPPAPRAGLLGRIFPLRRVRKFTG